MSENPNFVGSFFYSIDSKNRLAVPSKFRFYFRSRKELVLSQGLEGCLNLYPLEAWGQLKSRLETMSLKNKMEQRAFKRMLYSSASEVELDEEGRILIDQSLVDYAQLKREAAIIGLGEKIEIWSKEKWEAYRRRQKSAFSRHADELEI